MQDFLKQRTPFLRRAVRIALGKLEHCILHDVQRLVAVAGGHLRNPVGAALNAGQKPVQGIGVGQNRYSMPAGRCGVELQAGELLQVNAAGDCAAAPVNIPAV